ncbi:hypothetical protein [Lentzea aerocolonigenes]|nr:hypothetical protein [Lentzea aerocolonigenes]
MGQFTERVDLEFCDGRPGIVIAELRGVLDDAACGHRQQERREKLRK